MNDTINVVDQVRLNFSTDSLLALNFTLAFIMFGVALDIKTGHFKQLIKNPKPAIVGVISQFVLLPAITFLLAILLGTNILPTMAIGMILVASCPGGNVSNFMTHIAKGNAALSVSLTAIATIGAVVITPLNFKFWGSLYNKYQLNSSADELIRQIDIDLLQMFYTVFILLGIPIILGMSFAAKFPGLTEKISKPIKTISFVAFIGIVVLAFTKNYDHFINHVGTIFYVVLIHNAVALLTGFTFSSAFKLPNIDRRSISIETGIQNSGLGLVLIFNPKIFPPELTIGGMAIVTAWWGIWHILSGLSIASIWARIPIKNKL